MVHIPASHADDAESPLDLRNPSINAPSGGHLHRADPLGDRCQFMVTPLMRLPIPTILAVHSVRCLVDPPLWA